MEVETQLNSSETETTEKEATVDLEAIFASCDEQKMSIYGECIWNKKMEKLELICHVVEMIHSEFQLGDFSVQIGDIIKFKRSGEGIIGGLRNLKEVFIIHYSGEVASKTNASVRVDPFEIVLAGCSFSVVRPQKSKSKLEILASAISRLGETNYNLFWNNCEHFANEIAHGSKKSEQVVKYAVSGSLIAISVLALASLKPLVEWWWNPDLKKKTAEKETDKK